MALFQVGTGASAIAQSMTILRSDPNAIPQLTVVEVNINGRSYAPINPESSDKSKEVAAVLSNAGMIAGIVVGVIVLVLVIATIIGVRMYKVKKDKHTPIVESGYGRELEEINPPPISIQSPRSETPVRSPTPDEERVTSPVMEHPTTTIDRIDSAPIFSVARSRSVSVDLDVIDCDENPNADDSPMRRPFIDFQLIDFD